MIDEELVAWVDENENFIKAIPISLANSDPKYLHQEIAGIIYDNQRRVLLQQRSLSKKVSPGLWTVTVAGHVTFDDTLVSTFHKELKEEMGLTTTQSIYLFKEKVYMANETHFCHWFLARYSGEEIVIDPSEVAAFEWVAAQDFPSFVNRNRVSDRTIKMVNRFWAGEWDNLLK